MLTLNNDILKKTVKSIKKIELYSLNYILLFPMDIKINDKIIKLDLELFNNEINEEMLL